MTLDSHADARVSTPHAGAVPAPPYRHLFRLTDDTGLFEHARGPVPKRWHGYCVDDVARGLLVVCREPEPASPLVGLAERYLSFVIHAQDKSGLFHNRLGYDRVWHDEPSLGDWWGRGLWGLGTAAARGATPWIRSVALERFERSAHLRSPHVRAMAFAALGAAEIVAVDPGHEPSLGVLADAAAMVGGPAADPAWPWPEERLTYSNAALPEVLIAAGQALGDAALLERGLSLLAWLVGVESHEGHVSVTPIGGWRAGEPRPGFGQQPIEVAALADACCRAYEATGDPDWLAAVQRCVAWFLGDNDSRLRMIDSTTGGGFDGLQETDRNPNQGAESTLAMIGTLQHGRRWSEAAEAA